MVASVDVIFPVELAEDMAWKMIGDMTRAMTTAMASLMKWLPALPSTIFLFLPFLFVALSCFGILWSYVMSM